MRSSGPPRFVVACIAFVILTTSVVFVVSPWPRGHDPSVAAKPLHPPPRSPSACEAARQMKALGKTREHDLYFAQCRAQGGE